MLSLLFGFNYLYDLLIVVVICATIVLCVKSDGFRDTFKLICKYVGLPLCAILMVGSVVYSCIHLNIYYSAQGGIYGQLSHIFGQNNQVSVEVDEKIFSFKDVILTQEDGDIYSVKMLSEKVIKLKSDESYAIYINNTPCTYSETSPDHFKALYTYNFYNKEDVCEKTDTLELYFQLNNKGIEIEVQTRGGSSAVRYWNNYFNKNGFEVKIAKTEKQNNENINIGEGDVSNFVVASFYNGEEVYLTQVYHPGDKVTFPNVNEDLFYGWAIEENGEVIFDYTISQSTNFYAVYKDVSKYTVSFYLDREGETLHYRQVIDEGEVFNIPAAPEGLFAYWENDEGTQLTNAAAVYSDLSFYAVFYLERETIMTANIGGVSFTQKLEHYYTYSNKTLPICKSAIDTAQYEYELIINGIYTIKMQRYDTFWVTCGIDLISNPVDLTVGMNASNALSIEIKSYDTYTDLYLAVVDNSGTAKNYYTDWLKTNGFSIELIQIRK